MSNKNQHFVPHQSGWAVKGAGNERASSVHGTQREAIAAARETAMRQGSEMLIHGENGRTRERNTYGADPFPPSGGGHIIRAPRDHPEQYSVDLECLDTEWFDAMKGCASKIQSLRSSRTKKSASRSL